MKHALTRDCRFYLESINEAGRERAVFDRNLYILSDQEFGALQSFLSQVEGGPLLSPITESEATPRVLLNFFVVGDNSTFGPQDAIHQLDEMRSLDIIQLLTIADRRSSAEQGCSRPMLPSLNQHLVSGFPVVS